MTAIVLPDVDPKTIDELRKRIPNLSEIDLPSLPKMELPTMKEVSKSADQTIDRLLGRSRAPVWPWVAAGIGLVAVIGAIAAYFAWMRKPSWDASDDAWSATTGAASIDDSSSIETDDLTSSSLTGQGLSAAESSLASTTYPAEEA
jgi:hypothetical protein